MVAFVESVHIAGPDDISIERNFRLELKFRVYPSYIVTQSIAVVIVPNSSVFLLSVVYITRTQRAYSFRMHVFK